MRTRFLFWGLIWPGMLASAIAASAEVDSGWPTEVNYNGNRIVIYQPQANSWKKNRLEARSAVTVTGPNASKALYGIVSLAARTDVDKEDRAVTLEDLKVTSALFPANESEQSDLLKTIRESLPQWPVTVSLDRLLADLSITEAETDAEQVKLRNTPPKIIVSSIPAVLISIDGEPFYRSVAGTPYTRVTNTPALLLFNSSAGRFYLDGGNRWMTAAALNGPWNLASNPPADLDGVKTQCLKGEDQDPHDHSHDPDVPPSDGPPRKVYVTTTPAELLQTEGAPQYSPIPRTELVYATNTGNDLFMDVKTQEYYTLLSGRWYQTKSVNGSWTFVPGTELPNDFKRIPPQSPKGRVLASVPGTAQAKEAVAADQIPQTATVNRRAAKLNVTYDGAPQFEPVAGTALEYAVNSADDVIYADERYYAVHDAVWFVADGPDGPWAVADSVPPAIYSMPPSCPLFHDRYVYVYGAAPDYVYEGYTPGYLGSYYDDGVVVFGTGWNYPAWYGNSYYGWPWTWGFGWQFGYWGSGWFDRPVGYPWWYHNPAYMHRVYGEHWNPHWHPGDWQAFQNNVNVYHRWGQNTVLSPRAARGIAERNVLTRQNALALRDNRGLDRSVGPREDLYAGRDGHVYQHRQNGWFQHGGPEGNWSQVPAGRGLEMQRQSRALGESRWREFHGSGGFSGMARMPGGFSGMPRTTMPNFAAHAPGFGGRGGGIRR